MLAESKLVEAGLKMRDISRKNVKWYLFYGFIAIAGVSGMIRKAELMAQCDGYADGVKDSLMLLENQNDSETE